MQFVDLKTQQQKIEELLQKGIAHVLSHNQYINGGEVKALEDHLSQFVGASYAISCGNGTDALQIALMSLDLKSGDEIITTPFTFFATAEVISLLKLKPVFVDIEEETYNIDASRIEEKITQKTKAIVPVSLYGQCADMDEINSIADRHNISVIEDAAQSLGAMYKKEKSGNLSGIATTSFFPSKPLGCYGDGGMVFTSNESTAQKLRRITDHGQDGRYHHIEIGVNSRLDSLQAAVLLAKMTIFEEEIRLRQEIGRQRTEALQNFVKTPRVKEDRTSVYAQYTIEVENRDLFQKEMQLAGIPTAVHYPVPLHFQPVFKNIGSRRGDLPIAEKASEKVVSLPLHPYLTENDQEIIIEHVKKWGQ